MFIKATTRHDEKIVYFNVDKIITIEPLEYLNSGAIIKCD